MEFNSERESEYMRLVAECEQLRAQAAELLADLGTAREYADRLHNANERLSGKLLEEGEKRKAALKRLLEDVRQQGEQLRAVVHQRDTAVAMLKALTNAYSHAAAQGPHDGRSAAFHRLMSHAVGLVKLIDSLQAP